MSRPNDSTQKRQAQFTSSKVYIIYLILVIRNKLVTTLDSSPSVRHIAAVGGTWRATHAPVAINASSTGDRSILWAGSPFCYPMTQVTGCPRDGWGQPPGLSIITLGSENSPFIVSLQRRSSSLRWKMTPNPAVPVTAKSTTGAVDHHAGLRKLTLHSEPAAEIVEPPVECQGSSGPQRTPTPADLTSPPCPVFVV